MWGYFGKVPAAGDFLRGGLAQGFVEPWDAWLQAGLVAGRGALAAGWDEAYMVAPIWRFTLAPGICGQLGALGVVMPSVDRVGRQFPLTLAHALPEGVRSIAVHMSAGYVFARLESLALSMLEETATVADLKSRLEKVDAPTLIAPDSPGWEGRALAIHGHPAAVLGEAALSPTFGEPSLWTALGDAPVTLVHDGMPTPEETVRLFSSAAATEAA